MAGMGKWPRGGPYCEDNGHGACTPALSARGGGLRLRVLEEAYCDEVVVFDTSERERDVDCSSDEESELRDIIGLGWYKREKGTQDGGGVRDQGGQEGAEQGGRKSVGCQAWVAGWVVGGGRGRKWVGLRKEAGSRACL